MSLRNILLVFFFISIFSSVYSWGFPAEEDEVLKPQLRSALNGTALRPQATRSIGGNYKARFNTGNQSAVGMKEEISQESSREVTETQHATCKINTEELVATAQATVTRVLKGLCNTSK